MFQDHASSPIKANFLEILGSALLHLKESFFDILKLKIQKEQFISRLEFIGIGCLPMILILSGLGTMILTVNTAIELSGRGGRDLIGALIALAAFREIIPIFISFAISARCGTSLTAEIATMKVTDQIDVLKVLKISPIYYLLTPSLVAVVVLSPFLLAISSISSTFAGMITAKILVGVSFTEFLDSAWRVVSMKEYFYPLIKTIIFSTYALLLNISMGLNCSGGAREVGLTTTRSTALVIVGIIILDGILTPILHG
jgi:phospholipid/cholesterol/gamma-HCH transport system permease protein